MALQYLTISWILPIPLMIVAAYAYLGWFRPERLLLSGLPPAESKSSVVNFLVTTTGANHETACYTLESTLYWTARHPETCFDSAIWLLIEESGYLANRERFDVFKERGVRIVVTPADYRTPRGTTRKGRALQYAVERRHEAFPDLSKVWVYHQDEETAIGEDTVLGIDEFVRGHQHDQALGVGLILYDQHFSWRPSQLAELARTDTDLRLMFSVVRVNNPFGGFHGSHWIMRADAEEDVGWDVGPGVLTEDLIFELRTRLMKGGICHVLKGVVHEMAPLVVRDQLRQRRRWVQGIESTYVHYKFRAVRRAVLTYSMFAWYCAVFAIPSMVLALTIGFGPIISFERFLTGFIWVSLVAHFYRGWVLHRPYVAASRQPLRILAMGIFGSYTDGIAPWYASLTKRPAHFEVIRKDASR